MPGCLPVARTFRKWCIPPGESYRALVKGICRDCKGCVPYLAVTPHGVLPKDSHEIPPPYGGVHKLMILLRDLVKEPIQKIFAGAY